MKVALIMGANDFELQESKAQTYIWKQLLLKQNPLLNISIYPDETSNLEQIDILLVNKYPYGILKQFTKIKAILVLAAGVDYVLNDPELPNVPITRLEDNDMAKQVAQYAVTYTLNIIKRVNHWKSQQNQQIWAKNAPYNYADKVVGIMGLGFMGTKIASMLDSLQIKTIGWSRTSKNLEAIRCYSGQSELNEFLSKTDILICILPLTVATSGILNLELFKQLKPGSDIINIGRGAHLVEQDLLTALENNHLSSAVLDVFNNEPLPKNHPFWLHPKITITPHIASVSNPETSIVQVLQNIKRISTNQPLINQIELAVGY